MNKQTINYRFACVVLGGLMVAMLGCFALGIVWVRQGSNSSAKQVQQLERKLEVAQRRLRFVNEKFAEAHMPNNLVRMAGAKMGVPSNDQVIWIAPQQRLIANQQRVTQDPYAVSFELAFLDTTRRP